MACDAQRACHLLTTVGLQFGALMGQAVVVEKLFSWPGIGSLLVDSVLQRDIPAVQGSILVVVLSFLAINLLIDVALRRDRSQDQIRMKLRANLIIGGALFALAILVGLLAPWLAHTDPVLDANC